jgi:methionyl-tRNA formyltransferase
MGTPEFAVPCLRELIKTEDVAAVFTKADKPSGRGKKLLPSAVKTFALDHGLDVYTPRSLKKGDDAENIYTLLCDIAPDLIIVAAYGLILPERILTLPSIMPKCINLHGSLLPKYRGAAPIERAVLDGETETGITAMVMADGIDTGDMLIKKTTPIYQDETAAKLRDRLSELAAETLMKTLSLLKAGTLIRTPQNESLATYAPMTDKEMCRIDFSKPAEQVRNLIRAVTGFAFLDGKRIKIFSTRKTDIPSGKLAPGTLISDTKLFVACGDKLLEITELLPEGGKHITGTEFLRGHNINTGTVLGRE